MPVNRTLLSLAIAGGVGVLTVVAAALWLRAHNASELVPVVVAAREIEAGVSLQKDYLRLTDWPKSSVPHGVSHSVEALDGRISRTAIAPNELVLERNLMAKGSAGSLAAVITPGMRAITIPVNEVAGVAGFALPGNYVDVMLSTRDDTGQAISKIVLERVLVLAVDQDRSIKDESRGRVSKAVTVEVTPQQAERIDVARAVGGLTLVLRSQEDDQQPVRGSGARKGDFTLSTPSTQSGLPSVEVIRGTTRRIETGIAQ